MSIDYNLFTKTEIIQKIIAFGKYLEGIGVRPRVRKNQNNN